MLFPSRIVRKPILLSYFNDKLVLACNPARKINHLYLPSQAFLGKGAVKILASGWLVLVKPLTLDIAWTRKAYIIGNKPLKSTSPCASKSYKCRSFAQYLKFESLIKGSKVSLEEE